SSRSSPRAPCAPPSGSSPARSHPARPDPAPERDMAAHGVEGRAYLVTGAASGIGKGTATALVAAGASVALLDRDEDRLTSVASSLGASARALPTDVAEEVQVAAAVDATIAAFGRLDGVATCAGVFDPADLVDLDALDMDVYDRVLGINLRGTVLVL